jgi:hypothetical protein
MSFAQLRPLSFGEILDGAFSIFRRHFSTLFVVTLLPLLPSALIWIGVLALQTGNPETDSIIYLMAALGNYPFSIAGYVLVRGAVTRVVANAYLGYAVSREDALRHAWRCFFPLVLTMILYGIAVTVGTLFFVVPGVIAAIGLFAYVQVSVVEGSWGPEALQRSWALARGAWGRIMGMMLVLMIIVYLPVIAMGAGAVFLLVLGGDVAAMADPAGATTFQALVQLGSLLVQAMTTPLTVAAFTLLYFDRRVRTEALDLQFSAPAAAPSAAGAPA